MMFGQFNQIRNVGVKTNGLNNINVYVFFGDSLLGVVLSPVIDEEPVGFDPKYQAANRVIIYHKPDRTSTANGSWQVYKTRATPTINRMPGETVLAEGPYEFGIDQSFVYGMDNSVIKKNIAVLKVAKGGSMLIARTGVDNDWVPTGNELYLAAINYFVRVGIPNLYALGYRKVTVKAIIISLGTNDCATARWIQAAFLAAVPNFIRLIREELGNAPIYWGQVRTDLGVVGGFDSTSVGQCRTILTNCKAGGSTAISGFNLIETWESDATIDGVHPDSDSCLARGAALATTMIALGE